MDLVERVSSLNFAVEKSLRYHQRRRAHYERLHKWFMFGIILAGSAAFSTVVGKPEILGMVAAALAALDLVFGFSHRARDHELLHRRFTDLAADVRAITEPTGEKYEDWNRRRLEIEADELPIYWALEASCDNEVAVAWGQQAHGLVPLSKWRRLMMNWLTFDKAEFGIRRSANDAEQSFDTMAGTSPSH